MDMIIKNGLVFDGSGELPIRKNIAVKDGIIMGQASASDMAMAKHVIDAAVSYTHLTLPTTPYV